MKAGQITAKLRDAVPVFFYQDGEEVIRYKNIEISETAPEEPTRMEARFNVTGDQRKALVAAVQNFIRMEPVYKAAPTFPSPMWWGTTT